MTKINLKAKNIPNYLTIFRIIIALIIICFLLIPFGDVVYTIRFVNGGWIYEFKLSFFLAGILFVIASISDFLDGYIARKYKFISE
jgi:CDP-diacylglycerol--glycerol-3-phosphate 3-phosphatidyltransferase